MKRFKLGDKVVLKGDIDKRDGRNYEVTSRVKELKGKILTVSALVRCFSEVMAIEVEEDTDIALEFDWVKRFKPYKKGDKVKLKKELEEVNGLFAWASMKGKTFEIQCYDEEDNTYSCTNNSGQTQWISHEWIDRLVKKDSNEPAKFKVGDIVKVKKSLAHKEEFKGCCVTEGMRNCAGKKVEITKVVGFDEGLRYIIKGCIYYFTSDMFKDKIYNEDEEKKESNDEYEDDCMDYDDYYAEVEDDNDHDDDDLVDYGDDDDDSDDDNGDEPKFKLGDKVRIINDGSEYEYHHNYNIGEVVTIKSYGLGAYICENSNGHTQYIREESIVPVTETEKEDFKFKLGDKVKVVGNSEGTYDKDKHFFNIGDKVKIIGREDEAYICINEDGLRQAVLGSYLEPYNEDSERDEFISWVIENADEMTFEEMEDEYACVLKYGDLELKISTPINTIKMCEEAGFSKSEVNELLFTKMADSFVFAENYIKILKENDFERRFKEEVE